MGRIPDLPTAAGDDTGALVADEFDRLVMPKFDRIGDDAPWRESVRRRAPDHADALRTAMRKV